jgi:hypothetical protein
MTFAWALVVIYFASVLLVQVLLMVRLREMRERYNVLSEEYMRLALAYRMLVVDLNGGQSIDDKATSTVPQTTRH